MRRRGRAASATRASLIKLTLEQGKGVVPSPRRGNVSTARAGGVAGALGLRSSRLSPLPAAVSLPRPGAALPLQHIFCIASRVGRKAVQRTETAGILGLDMVTSLQKCAPPRGVHTLLCDKMSSMQIFVCTKVVHLLAAVTCIGLTHRPLGWRVYNVVSTMLRCGVSREVWNLAVRWTIAYICLLGWVLLRCCAVHAIGWRIVWCRARFGTWLCNGPLRPAADAWWRLMCADIGSWPYAASYRVASGACSRDASWAVRLGAVPGGV